MGRILSHINAKEEARRRVPKASVTWEEQEKTRMRRLRERTRKRGKEAVEKALECVVYTITNPHATIREQLEASYDVLDRFGWPRHQVMGGLEEEVDRPKTLAIVSYPAPAGWNGDRKNGDALPGGNGEEKEREQA